MVRDRDSFGFDASIASMEIRDRLLRESKWLRQIARALLRDEHLAEDLSQEALMAALVRPPHSDNVRGWLHVVLRRMAWLRVRRDARRSAREREVSVPDWERSAADETERRFAHEAVTQAVLRLDEPLRTTLLLRFWSDLSIPEIAEKMEVSHEAARQRVQRGLERLRQELPEGVAPALMWFAFPGAPQREAARAPAVTAPRMVLAAVVVICVAWLSLTWGRGDRATDSPAESRRVSDAAEPVGGTRAASRGLRAPEVLREEVDPRSSARSLAVRVRAEHGASVGGVTVSLRPAQDRSWLREVRAVTSAEGIATFADDDLPPGDAWAVRSDRGEEPRRVEGGTSTVELRLPRGASISGTVKGPDGEPLAAAPVWLVPPGRTSDEGAVVATTTADGRFALEHVLVGSAVAALPPGFAASWPVVVEAPGADLELKCWPRRMDLRGSVRGPGGEAVERAAVLVGWAVPAGVAPPPSRLRTASDGAFVCSEQGHMETPVWVCAPGFAVQRLLAREEGGREFDIRLSAGGAVEGVVVDLRGDPVAEAVVEVRQEPVEPPDGMAWDGPGWGRLSVVAGRDGRFVVDAIHPGRVELRCVAPAGGVAEAVLELNEGERLRWDPVVGRGCELRAVVQDSARVPLAGMHATVRRVGAQETTDLVTSGEGELRLPRCPEGAVYRIQIRQPDAIVGRHTWTVELAALPGQVHPIVVPEESIARHHASLELVGPDGAPVGAAEIALVGVSAGGVVVDTRWQAEAEGGRYEFGPVLPGRYACVVSTPELGPMALGNLDMGAGGDQALGTRVFAQPGAVRLRVRRPDGQPLVHEFIPVFGDALPRPVRLPLHSGVGGVALQPGRYQVSYSGGEGALCNLEFEVGAGERIPLVMDLQEGVVRRFRFRGMARSRDCVSFGWYREGREVYRDYVELGLNDTSEFELPLMPGSYRVIARDHRGQSAVTEFVVADQKEANSVIELDCALGSAGDAGVR